jgi:hypothetical protein
MRSACLMILTASGLLASPDASPARAAGQPEPLKKLHAILVFDTNDRDKIFNDSLRKDRDNLKSLFERAVPKDRTTMRVFQGSDANKRAILSYIKGLAVGPDEGLFFYYCGHGAIDKKSKKHYFQMRLGEVYRDEVLDAMKKKGAPLVVLLTDCCSSLADAKSPPVMMDPGSLVTPKAISLKPAVKSLLFQARGTIDITAAAADTPSWSDPFQGGVFTRTFCNLVQNRQFGQLDKDGDGLLTWKEFFDTLQPETNKVFKAWRKEMDPRGRHVKEPAQIPTAFKIEQAPPRVPVVKPTTAKKSYAMVGLRNSTDFTFTYRYRWAGKEWVVGQKMKPGENKVFSAALPVNAEPPNLEIDFDEKGLGLQRIPSHEWVGTAPTPDTVPQQRHEIIDREKKK